MKYFKISISRNRYNKAFEGYRDQWLKQNFTLIVIVIIVVIVAWAVTKKILKKKKQNSSGKGGA